MWSGQVYVTRGGRGLLPGYRWNIPYSGARRIRAKYQFKKKNLQFIKKCRDWLQLNRYFYALLNPTIHPSATIPLGGGVPKGGGLQLGNRCFTSRERPLHHLSSFIRNQGQKPRIVSASCILLCLPKGLFLIIQSFLKIAFKSNHEQMIFIVRSYFSRYNYMNKIYSVVHRIKRKPRNRILIL